MKRERYGYPILTADQTRAMDARVEQDYGLPLAVLMENAGRAVADAAMRLGGERIFIAIGPGNNGGDALVAALILHGRGKPVVAALVRPPEELSGLAALAARRFLDAGGCTVPAGGIAWEFADLIIDGLLGTGIAGPAREPLATVIGAINEAGRPVLSIDVPSGLDSDAGAEPAIAVQATHTIALGCYKPALVHFPAARWAGTVELSDIGFPPGLYPAAGAQVLTGSFMRDVLPVFPEDSHKGLRGTLLVLAGSRGMVGAAALSSQAATHAGAGLVYLACPESLASVFEVKLTDQVLRPVPDGGAARLSPESVETVCEYLPDADAVVLGPGLSHDDSVSAFVEQFLPIVNVPIVIDADGLNILAMRKLQPPPQAVLTPHPGEMGRLLECSVPDVQRDRVAAVRRATERFGCVVVLKGAHTVIAAPGEPVVVNTRSHPVLATGGTGDLLSGVIGALLAQKVPPFEAALAGVRWHGTAGALAASNQGGTLGASDILHYISRAREEIIGNEESDVLV